MLGLALLTLGLAHLALALTLTQEALSAPLSAQRPLTTTHRRSPRLSDSPLWGVGSGGFLAGSEVADMLK